MAQNIVYSYLEIGPVVKRKAATRVHGGTLTLRGYRPYEQRRFFAQHTQSTATFELVLWPILTAHTKLVSSCCKSLFFFLTHEDIQRVAGGDKVAPRAAGLLQWEHELLQTSLPPGEWRCAQCLGPVPQALGDRKVLSIDGNSSFNELEKVNCSIAYWLEAHGADVLEAELDAPGIQNEFSLLLQRFELALLRNPCSDLERPNAIMKLYESLADEVDEIVLLETLDSIFQACACCSGNKLVHGKLPLVVIH